MMTNPTWKRTLSRTLASTLAAAVLTSAPLAAQQAARPSGPAQQTPAPQGPILRLSMGEAVAMALEYNLGLKADRMTVDVADQNIVSARAAYLPQVSSSLSRQSNKSVPSDFTQGLQDITSQGSSLAATLTQFVPWYGGDYGVSWQANRRNTIGGFPTSNPNITSTLSLSFNQPLWRDFKIDSARAGLETSERSRSIADLQLQQQIVGFEVTVKFAYLNLIAAVEGRKVAQQNMDIFEQSLRNARARVAVGQSPQIDVIQAEAQVASSREALIAAVGRIGTAEDSLRQLILDPLRPDYWTVQLETTDDIQVTPFQVDIDAATKNALANRLDLLAVRENMEIIDLRMDLNKNLTLPSIDMQLRYSASGTGGTRLEFGEGFPPPITNRSDKGFGSVLGDTFSGAYPSWSAAVVVGYPIGKTAARAGLATTEIQKRQQELDMKNLELQIVRDVREAARQVQNSFERVQAAKAAQDASVLQLNAEDRRFEVGLSTPLDQQIRQQELARARNSYLQAMISYNSALINFERVQKIQ